MLHFNFERAELKTRMFYKKAHLLISTGGWGEVLTSTNSANSPYEVAG
jgi:hypothetical protein